VVVMCWSWCCAACGGVLWIHQLVILGFGVLLLQQQGVWSLLL
jgi:hypothetical protein